MSDALTRLVPATASRTRTRVDALRAGAAGAGAVDRRPRSATDALARHLVALELPAVDDEPLARRLARDLLIGVVPLSLIVVVAAGSVALALTALVVLGADVAARRSAPARALAAVERQLPSTLESVARRLRAGGSLAQALVDAAPARPAELRRSWAALVEQVPIAGVEVALRSWASSSPLPSVQLAGAALSLAASTGGSPARAIDGVAGTLRARHALADEIRALSAQSRASALVIAVSPLVFGAAAAATDDRTGAFLRTAPGLVVVGAGLALDLVGWRWMSRLCLSPSGGRRRR